MAFTPTLDLDTPPRRNAAVFFEMEKLTGRFTPDVELLRDTPQAFLHSNADNSIDQSNSKIHFYKVHLRLHDKPFLLHLSRSLVPVCDTKTTTPVSTAHTQPLVFVRSILLTLRYKILTIINVHKYHHISHLKNDKNPEKGKHPGASIPSMVSWRVTFKSALD